MQRSLWTLETYAENTVIQGEFWAVSGRHAYVKISWGIMAAVRSVEAGPVQTRVFAALKQWWKSETFWFLGTFESESDLDFPERPPDKNADPACPCGVQRLGCAHAAADVMSS
jgi:hypothetical protein